MNVCPVWTVAGWAAHFVALVLGYTDRVLLCMSAGFTDIGFA